ncbi:helicase associated domain-containing protein [[Kitasatospora] papulosa]|uniref:helicase associated domain-containing protein n=1 Tax=[Kitasatospora] papulosa TaxID=1464011 RepID=UPI00363BAB6D
MGDELRGAQQFYEREKHLRVSRKHVERIVGKTRRRERKLGAWVGDRRSRAATLTPERMEHLSETGVRRGVAGAGSEQSICLTQMFVSTDAQVAAILDFLHGENAAYDAPDATRFANPPGEPCRGPLRPRALSSGWSSHRHYPSDSRPP